MENSATAISYSGEELNAIQSAADAGVQIIDSYVDRGEREDNESLDYFPVYNVSLHVGNLKTSKEILKNSGKDIAKYEAAITKGEAFLNG